MMIAEILSDPELREYIDNNTQDPLKKTVLAGYIPLLPSHKGGFGELVARKYLKKTNHVVRPRINAGHDLVVNDSKVEVKFSLAHKKGKGDSTLVKDKFTINHVSLGKDWDELMFIGVNPDFEETKIFTINKADVADMISNKEYFEYQQGGKKVQNDDYMVSYSQLRKLMEDRRINWMRK